MNKQWRMQLLLQKRTSEVTVTTTLTLVYLRLEVYYDQPGRFIKWHNFWYVRVRQYKAAAEQGGMRPNVIRFP